MAGTQVLHAGEVIGGKYRIVRELATGAMGVVYLAQHISLGRQVAVKMLRSELLADADLAERFEREAQAASSIGHPHIVDVFDLGRTSDGGLYMVMELLHGHSLAELMRTRPTFPVPMAVDLCAQVLSALAAAHKRHIVHRDLKPENVFIVDTEARPSFVKLLDFGISKVLDPSGRSGAGMRGTVVGTVLGTPEYMAPEQARGKVELVDGRTDLYAAGVLLYELLCARTPYQGGNYNAVMAAIVAGDFPPPRTLRKDVSPALEAVVLRAMEWDRDSRFPTATSMREALFDALDESAPEMSEGDVKDPAHDKYPPTPPTTGVGGEAAPAIGSAWRDEKPSLASFPDERHVPSDLHDKYPPTPPTTGLPGSAAESPAPAEPRLWTDDSYPLSDPHDKCPPTPPTTGLPGPAESPAPPEPGLWTDDSHPLSDPHDKCPPTPPTTGLLRPAPPTPEPSAITVTPVQPRRAREVPRVAEQPQRPLELGPRRSVPQARRREHTAPSISAGQIIRPLLVVAVLIVAAGVGVRYFRHAGHRLSAVQLVVDVSPESAEILADGRAVSGHSIRLDEGQHLVSAASPGYQPRRVSLELRGDTTHLTLHLGHLLLPISPRDPAAPAPEAQATPPELDALFAHIDRYRQCLSASDEIQRLRERLHGPRPAPAMALDEQRLRACTNLELDSAAPLPALDGAARDLRRLLGEVAPLFNTPSAEKQLAAKLQELAAADEVFRRELATARAGAEEAELTLLAADGMTTAWHMRRAALAAKAWLAALLLHGAQSPAVQARAAALAAADHDLRARAADQPGEAAGIDNAEAFLAADSEVLDVARTSPARAAAVDAVNRLLTAFDALVVD